MTDTKLADSQEQPATPAVLFQERMRTPRQRTSLQKCWKINLAASVYNTNKMTVKEIALGLYDQQHLYVAGLLSNCIHKIKYCDVFKWQLFEEIIPLPTSLIAKININLSSSIMFYLNKRLCSSVSVVTKLMSKLDNRASICDRYSASAQHWTETGSVEMPCLLSNE
jgi:hypothetical protein